MPAAQPWLLALLLLALPSAWVESFAVLPRKNDWQQQPLLHATSKPPKQRQERRRTSAHQNHKDSIVLYQKIVHPPPGITSDFEFLGHLVSFLQDDFVLPDGLPMVYETEIPNEGSHDRAVLRWNSPLSPQPETTAMSVQVLVIDPHDNQDKGEHTTMALVAVQKTASSQALPPLLQGLFAESERRICRTLDQALLEFSTTTKSKQGRSNNNGIPKEDPSQADWMGELFEEEEEQLLAANQQAQERPVVEADAIVETVEPDATVNKKPYGTKKDIVDVEILSEEYKEVEQVKDDEAVQETNRDKKMARQKEQQEENRSQVVDFAVQAALKAKQKQKEEGFAVTAARKVAAKKQQRLKVQQKHQPDVNAGGTSPAVVWNETATPASLRPENMVRRAVYQTLDANNGTRLGIAQHKDMARVLDTIRRQFGSSASQNDRKRAQRRESPKPRPFKKHEIAVEYHPPRQGNATIHADNAPPTSTNSRTTAKGSQNKKNRPLDKLKKLKGSLSNRKHATTKPVVLAEDQLPSAKTKAPTETVMDAEILPPAPASSDVKLAQLSKVGEETKKLGHVVQGDDDTPVAVEDEDREAIQSVQDALEEMQSLPDMTPEQLLDDVMTFGEAKEQEERPGDGFVSGAFEKAKELLRQQAQQREERLNKASSSPISAKAETPTTKVVGETSLPRPPTAEEELKQLFQAGERFADGKIETSKDSTRLSSPQGTAEQDVVDALLAAEKEVSDYARVLDDELVELEVRLNKSPGEEMDGPASAKHPQFDIFSGPEVYNPNVDPETAVNWPGALPGTKTRKQQLPKELEKAVAQAQFAAKTLSKLEERVSKKEGSPTQHVVGNQEVSLDQVEGLRKVVADAVAIGLIRDPLHLMAERSRLRMLLDELWTQPEDRIKEVALNYKDLLLSENFVELVRERMKKMVERDLEALRRTSNGENDEEPEVAVQEERHGREREILGHLVVHTQLLLKEARALGAELEAQQLEIVRSICKVAMDPAHQTEEETAMALTDAVRDMRPLFDDAFVAYLKYAVEEEEGRLARAGVLDDPEHNQWLFVLRIVQNGVYTELSRGIQRYIDHIMYVLRMETPKERRMLLEKLIDVMPTLDVRPFVAVVDNIAGALGDSARGEFSEVTALGEMTNKILQLYKDVHDLLPPERIALKAKDADEWAASKKKQLLERREETKKRLEAAQKTEEYDDVIDRMERGDIERFDQ